MTTNKQSAVTFLQLAAAGKVKEAYDKYVSPNFRHHNPYFAGDAASLAKGMTDSAVQFPNKVFEVKRILEDGDLVAVHARVRISPDGPDYALIHIFRFENGKIAELWEAAQEVPKSSPNANGMF
ncbi:MAG: nuclear transport factor 2 family protein [candidate division Zixibacteria bacterium]|nr:nuclear transport factor 2 family protein [candidate division Zixibacteria bacterium]